MTKYLNPIKYINFLRKKIKLYYKNLKSKRINNLNFIDVKLDKINNIDELISFHFNTYSEPDHINREMFQLVLEHFSESSLNILETGSAAHGTKSSTLFANYVKRFGGTFDTVDTNPEIKQFYKFLETSNILFHTSDSLKYIENLSQKDIEKLDLIYLDSFDLDITNPEPSQEHGYKEFLLLNDNLKKGALVVIDDTPVSFEKFRANIPNKFNFIPGKGREVLNFVTKNEDLYEVLYHEYSVVLEKK